MENLKVDLDKRSYEIIIGENLLQSAGERIKALGLYPTMFIVTDENVARHHLATLEQSLTAAGITYHSIILKPGEQTKCFAELEKLLDAIFVHKPERNVTLIALGGGVMGDLTGFAASILLRGVNFIQIPTTLLAQVDSSVGGKTGINNHFGKNLVGSFYQPKLVLADLSLLATLPDREFKAGYAEVVKYGLINDVAFFDWLDTSIDKINARDNDALRYAVHKSCQSKADVVAQDEREGGMRALLNLGHTFGHALEVEMGYGDKLLHGEAVAIGMIMAFDFSARLGLCPKEDAERVRRHVKAAGLPTSVYDINSKWDAKALVQHMYQDKKVSSGKLVFILARGIGKSFVAKDVAEADVSAFIASVLSR